MIHKLESNTGTHSSSEAIKNKMKQRIEIAKNNPILESRLSELEQELSLLKDKFIETGQREPQDTATENTIETEILRSSAQAHTLPEFREMLEQIALTYGKSKEWVLHLLAHENAHASVAEQTEHDQVKYATIFIRDNAGSLVSMQPLTLSKPQLSWGPMETLAREIEVLDAPRKYGNAPSDFDTADIARVQEKLDKMRSQEVEKQKRIDELQADINRILKNHKI